MVHYKRLLSLPEDSFFLWGPRQSGKTTLLQARFPEAHRIDLLRTDERIRYEIAPYLLREELRTISRNQLIVIDEVQKVPALLDEVHGLIENKGLRFVLSGSSARKLRRGASNLLAGRAIVKQLYPLVSAETGWDKMGEATIERGSLPLAITAPDPKQFLAAYAQTYLQEEIRAEALTRNIGDFGRFLEIAARQNGQVTNVSGLARDAEVGRTTVQNYFSILEDTLLGVWLHPWKRRSATRQIAHPKFYFFDSGVCRALTGRLPYPASPEEKGPLLETWLLQEIRAYLDYRQRHYPVHFWKTHDGAEVDLFLEDSKGYLAVEIKSSRRWDGRFNRSLKRLPEIFGGGKVRCFGVFAGERPANWEGIKVLPIRDFLEHLWGDTLIV